MADRKCYWCEDEDPEHKHYAVLVKEDGKTLGRLTPKGTATRLNIYATIFSKARATEIAQEITDNGVFSAKAIKF